MRAFALALLLTSCGAAPGDVHSAIDQLCGPAAAATPALLATLPAAEAKVLQSLHNACAERDLLLSKSAKSAKSVESVDGGNP